MGPMLQGGGGLTLQPARSPQKTANPQPAATAPGNFTTTYNPQPQYAAPAPSQSAAVAPPAPTGPPPPPPDPYAGTVFGSTDNFNRIRNGWNDQVGAFNGSLGGRYDSAAGTYNSGILDYVDSMKSGTRALSGQYVQNELGRQQGVDGVIDMVGNGVRSAGVKLANTPGAANSSASEAVARAYATIGGREMSKVGNEFEQREYATDQNKLSWEDQMATAGRKLEERKTELVNNIVTDASNQIAQLNADAINASLPDRIDIENRKAQIRNEALGRLTGLDGKIAEGKNSNKVWDDGQVRGEATRLKNAGTAVANPFNFSSGVPAEFAGTGPFTSDLPLFQMRGRGREQ